MRIETYQGHEIIILDDDADATVPLPEGMVVARFGPGWTAFTVDGPEVVSMTGASPVQSAEAAVAVIRQSIDGWVLQEARSSVERAEAPVPVGPLPNPSAEPENPIFGRRAQLQLQVHVVVDAFNSLPPDSPAREALLAGIKANKASLLSGFVMMSDGKLQFDEARYSVGYYRRKQATYARAALEKLQEAARSVLMTNDYLDDESRAGQFAQIAGVPLAPIDEPPRETFAEASRVFQVAMASTSNVHQRLEGRPQAAPALGGPSVESTSPPQEGDA